MDFEEKWSFKKMKNVRMNYNDRSIFFKNDENRKIFGTITNNLFENKVEMEVDTEHFLSKNFSSFIK